MRHVLIADVLDLKKLLFHDAKCNSCTETWVHNFQNKMLCTMDGRFATKMWFFFA